MVRELRAGVWILVYISSNIQNPKSKIEIRDFSFAEIRGNSRLKNMQENEPRITRINANEEGGEEILNFEF